MKFLLPVVLIVGVIALIFGLSKSQSRYPQGTAVKIGASYALTGPIASFGIEYRRGLELAADEINNSGGINGKKVELIFEDDQGDTTKALQSVNKLINIDKVDYLFTAFSSPSQATAPIAEKNKIIDISSTVDKVGTGNYVFRDYWDMTDQGAATGKATNKEGIKRLGVIALNFGDTQDFMTGLKSQTKAQIHEERFNFGDTDFKTQLSKIAAFNPDAILVYGFPGAEATKITQQIVELGLDNKRLFSGSTVYIFPFMTKPFATTLVKMGAIDTWYTPDSSNNKSKTFMDTYKTKYNEDVMGDAAYTYDDLYALKAAIEKSGNSASTETIAHNLLQTNLDGAGGTLTFDSKGNSMRHAVLRMYTTQGWTPYNL